MPPVEAPITIMSLRGMGLSTVADISSQGN
jgi:hypothetical protein